MDVDGSCSRNLLQAKAQPPRSFQKRMRQKWRMSISCAACHPWTTQIGKSTFQSNRNLALTWAGRMCIIVKCVFVYAPSQIHQMDTYCDSAPQTARNCSWNHFSQLGVLRSQAQRLPGYLTLATHNAAASWPSNTGRGLGSGRKGETSKWHKNEEHGFHGPQLL